MLMLGQAWRADLGVGPKVEKPVRGCLAVQSQHRPARLAQRGWLFGGEALTPRFRSPSDRLLWGVNSAVRMPWLTRVHWLTGRKAGVKPPTFTPEPHSVEDARAPFFSFEPCPNIGSRACRRLGRDRGKDIEPNPRLASAAIVAGEEVPLSATRPPLRAAAER